MKFCPKCGALMVMDPRRKVLRCTRCGYEETSGSSRLVLSRTIVHTEREKLTIIEGGKAGVPPNAVLLKGQVRCPRCDSDEVYAWQMQTRAADEPPTTFYKCAKCGHTWREY